MHTIQTPNHTDFATQTVLIPTQRPGISTIRMSLRFNTTVRLPLIIYFPGVLNGLTQKPASFTVLGPHGPLGGSRDANPSVTNQEHLGIRSFKATRRVFHIIQTAVRIYL